MDANKKKGNLASIKIRVALEQLPQVVSVVDIPEQNDACHVDLAVYAHSPHRSVIQFHVQSKYFSINNLQLANSHVHDWISENFVVVPMWWDERTDSVYWADLLRHIVRAGGLKTGGSQSFRDDLRHLDPRDLGSVSDFWKFALSHSLLWNEVRLSHTSKLTLARYLSDQEKVFLLPYDQDAVDLLLSNATREISVRTAEQELIAVVRRMRGRPGVDLLRLTSQICARFGVSHRDAAEQLANRLQRWCTRIADMKSTNAEALLRGYDLLQGIIAFEKDGDLVLSDWPQCDPRTVYEMSRVYDSVFMSEKLFNVIEEAKSANVVLQVLSILRGLQLPTDRFHWMRLKEIRKRRQATWMTARENDYTLELLDAHLTYTEATLGDEQAKTYLERVFLGKPAMSFFNALNCVQFDHDSSKLDRFFEERLCSNQPGDRFLFKIHEQMYARLPDTINPRDEPLRVLPVGAWKEAKKDV